MNKQQLLKTMVMAMGLMASGQLIGQASVGGNFGGPPDYLGWDSNTGLPLRVMNNGNEPIQWFTDSIQRMQLNQADSYIIGSTTFGLQAKDGALGLSPNNSLWSTGPGGPFSRLHLHDGNGLLTAGYRPWMDNGVTFTTNQDHMYVGHKVEDGGDQTAAVIQWADNELSPAGPDVMKFIFTSNFTGGSGPTSNDGREIARMHPTGYLGVGNWQATLFQPDERIDVLDRTIRIRKLIDDYRNDTIAKVVVVDTSGRLHWRPWPTGGGGGGGGSADCDWDLNASQRFVTTAWAPPIGAPADTCPDVRWKTGVGTNWPLYKMHISHRGNSDNGTMPGALRVHYEGEPTGWQYGSHTTLVPHSGYLDRAAAAYNSVQDPRTEGYGSDNRVHLTTSGGNATKVMGTRGRVQTDANTVSEANGARGEVDRMNEANIGASYGVYGASHGIGTGTTGLSHGGYMIATTRSAADSVNTIYGLRAIARIDAPSGRISRSCGVDAISSGYGTAPIGRSYGVKAWAANGKENYGIWAGVPPGINAGPAGSNWAGYFQGKLMVTDSAWVHGNILVTSDASLKTDIEDLQDPLDLVLQLNPKTYSFVADAIPQISLPSGQQIGLLAQEVQDILPVAVGSTVVPASVDTNGVVIHPQQNIRGINYNAIVPLLIGAIKEQNSEIAAQQAQMEALTDQAAANQAASDELEELRNRMDQLEQLLAACCQNPADPRNQMDAPTDGIEENERILRIQPNPFTEQTTIYYQLERSGRMQLMANSSDGKQLRVLEEAHREAAAYQYEWITNDLAPGIYYVTLLLDGEPVVKKAVKVR